MKRKPKVNWRKFSNFYVGWHIEPFNDAKHDFFMAYGIDCYPTGVFG